ARRRAGNWPPRPRAARDSSTAASLARPTHTELLLSKAGGKGSTGGAVGPFALAQFVSRLLAPAVTDRARMARHATRPIRRAALREMLPRHTGSSGCG